MKFIKQSGWLTLLVMLLIVMNCSSDEASGDASVPTPEITIANQLLHFGEIDVLSHSASQNFETKGTNLTNNLAVSASQNFQVSLDDVTFTNSISIDKSVANVENTTVYVRFSPLENAIGNTQGTLTLQSSGAAEKTMNVTGVGLSITPIITANFSDLDFGDVPTLGMSDAQILTVNGGHLETGIMLEVAGPFQVSLDGVTYDTAAQIDAATANGENSIYVRFAPTEAGNATGILTLQNVEAQNVTVTLMGNGTAIINNYLTFDHERLAFGGGFDQSSTQTFNLPTDLSNVATIKMYVRLTCPSGGCDEWDVYANVKVLDPVSGELYELGRYITPYWNDNSQLARGFEFDVTDFKSLLTGATQLRIRTECWNDRGYEVSVDFDYIEGTPDYPYYAISRVIAYDDWSTSGVPYGVSNNFDLDKTVTIPSNAEETHLRTIISGWGHATPNDSGGRGCAEWCFRTHDVKINGTTMFQHYLGPIGCASNPVSNQGSGNWQPDRAGWCPGMAVPTRVDEFSASMAGNSFSFEYDYQDWVNNGQNGDAFYATSTFVVVKSNTPISKPTVME